MSAIKNPDGTVTVRTTGKVARTGQGDGTAQTKPVQAKSSTASPRVVPVPGRGPVPKTLT